MHDILNCNYNPYLFLYKTFILKTFFFHYIILRTHFYSFLYKVTTSTFCNFFYLKIKLFMISCNSFSFSFRNIILDNIIQINSEAKRMSYFGFDLIFFYFSLIFYLLVYTKLPEYLGILLQFFVSYTIYM